MLYFFSGTPGSGKSLHASQMVDRWYRRGKNVIANFPINMEFWNNKKIKDGGQILYASNEWLTVNNLIEFADKNHERNKKGRVEAEQTLLIIDECQTMFNSRSWNQTGRALWIVFFTQHRKYGFDVILISQDKVFVDKQIRAVFEHDYMHRDIKNFKLFGQLIAFLFGGHLFICVKKWMANGKKDSASILFGLEKYYDLYDSYRIFDYEGLRPLSPSSHEDGDLGAPTECDLEDEDGMIIYEFTYT